MKNSKFSLVLLTVLFVGCGGSSATSENASDTNVLSETNTFKIAKDNSIHEVSGTFKNYKVVVYTDGTVEDSPSQSSKAVYGKINGESTASLLTINSNYSNDDAFQVKVFDKNNVLLGQSTKKVLFGEILEFSDIEIGGN